MTDNDRQRSDPAPHESREEGDRSLRIVRTFMTQNMADEDILALSTGRECELERIMGAIERSWKAAPGTLQHIVLYGNRGFGKSFMTRRVQIEATKRWPGIPFVLLPEEQHSLQRDPHALLDTIALKLRDARSGDDTAYQEGHFRWPTKDDREQRWQEAETRVEQALDTALPIGGTAVVVVENFDILLRRLFKDDVDEQRLRRWLDRRANRLMLFATATGTVDMDYDRPLFHAFESIVLEPWSSDECITYFNRLRDHQGLEPLKPEQEAKARAVADFIGGTPRLAQLLGEVLETEDALDVAEIMAALTDRLADYYRRRIEDLAPLSTGLLDALIRGGEPASQTELAARVGADSQSEIARVMADLQKADIIRGQPAPDSREKLYRVPDRVFVHYYRLRQGNRAAQETPLATILDFLRSFYSRDEQQQQSLIHLEAGRVLEAGLFSRLARAGSAHDADLHMRDFVPILYLYDDAVPGALDRSAEEVASLLEGERPEDAYNLYRDVGRTDAVGAVHAVIRAHALRCLGHTEKAKATLKTALEKVADDPVASFIVLDQLVFLTALDEIQHAVTLAEKLEKIGGLPDAFERRRARISVWRLFAVGREDEAAYAAGQAAQRAAESGDWSEEIAWLTFQTFVLSQTERHLETADVAARAAMLAAKAGDTSKEATNLRHRATSLAALGRHQEAVEVAARAVDIAIAAGSAGEETKSLLRQAFSLGDLGRHQEALEVTARALQRAAESGDAREESRSLRTYAIELGELGRHEEAIESAASAARRSAEAGDAWGEALGLRLQSMSLASLKRHEEAVTTLARSAQLAAQAGYTNEEAVSLYFQAHSLNVLGRHEEAWTAAQRSSDIFRGGTHDRSQLIGSILEGLRAAVVLSRSEVVRLFDEWIELYQRGGEPLPPNPARGVSALFIAVAKANIWNDLDILLEKRVKWLAKQGRPPWFGISDGAAFAQIAAEKGRAAGYEAMSGALPRIANLMTRLPKSRRDKGWLADICVGFAGACRDPGLLRDVAALIMPNLGPEADGIAELFKNLADVDEAKNPLAILARIDPDVATLIRRLRDLPDAEPQRVKRKK